MRHSIEPRRDFPKLTPCAARLAELLCIKLPEIGDLGQIKSVATKSDEDKAELDLLTVSPSGELCLRLLTSREGVELRFEEKGRGGRATVVFNMHPLNFHRTCEAAVDFVDKVAHGQIIVARESQRAFPLLGPRRLRLFDAGEIVGARAASILKVYAWKPLLPR
jgi:hypothetical protein